MELQVELMVFTLFVCLGAGIFAIQGLLVLVGKGERIQLPVLAASFASIVVGGAAAFLHLEHWERVFGGFGHLTSGITQELVAIAVFVAALAVYLVMWRRGGGEGVPKWCAVMALAVSAVLVAVMAHSYAMASRPVWDTPVSWLYYLANAAFLGALAVALVAGVGKDAGAALAVKAALVAGIVQAASVAGVTATLAMASASFASVGNYFDPTRPTKAMADPSAALPGILSGEHALLFWLGAVVVGLVVPVAAAVLARRREGTARTVCLATGLVCACVGGLCFRAVLYVLGFSVFMFY